MKQPAPIKWRNNPNDYSFPRSSKEAFGYEFTEDDFNEPLEKRAEYAPVIALTIVLGLWVLIALIETGV